MHFLRIFHAAVLVGLVVTATACQRSRQSLESAKPAEQADDDKLAARDAQATEARVVGKRLDAYIGEIYSSEQNALASQSADAEAPSFLRPPMQSNRYRKILVAMVPLALSASVAFAQTGTGKLASASIDELKQVYLACDLTASRQVLDMESAAHCSSVGEALQKRAFDGSFDRLLAWWRVEKHAASARPATRPMERDSR